MSKIYRCPVEVRGYELDSYDHVNHSVYINYLEHARWKMLDEEKITLATFEKLRRWPVISSLEVKYLKPTFMGEQLEIRSEVVEHTRTRFYIHQQIFRGETQVLEAKICAVIINELGKPAELPAEMERLWA